MRKLASIQKIENIRPIEGADSIECATVLGWNVVVKKGEHNPGDVITYVEVDSLLPESTEYEFLRKSSYRAPITEGENVIQRGGFKIRTIKLRGQISQGLILPVPNGEWNIGDDVTDVLGIIKYEPPVPVGMKGRAKGQFPSFIQKTDEIRIQSAPELLDPRLEYEAREKLDGTSVTAFIRDGEFGICSRNLLLDETDTSHVIVRYASDTGLKEKLEEICKLAGFEIYIQGELVGPGIQGNRYGLKEHRLYVFNVLNRCGKMPLATWAHLLYSRFDIAPFLFNFHGIGSVDAIVQASRENSLVGNCVREGIVCRNYENSISFKVINPDFLLKNDD